MTELKFSYEPWDRFNDQRALQVSTQRAFGLVENEIPFLTDQEDSSIERHRAPLVSEVAGLLAECLDWLRSEGVPPEEIQSKVRAARIRSLDRFDRKGELQLRKLHTFDAPDPGRKGESLSKIKKPKEAT